MRTFKCERLRDIVDEITPLLAQHWREIAHFKDIALEPDWEQYFKLEDMDWLRVFTVRDDEAPDIMASTLIGYAIFIVRSNPHYKSSVQATQDVIFIRPQHRGTGYKFIAWCDEYLRGQKVQVVYHHVKTAHNFGPMLERQGYKAVDIIYAKRLD